jgi:protein-S-isoprenylcysteine O-methyltransferase Ste14
MKSERPKDSPDVISCPPMVFAGALAAGMLWSWMIPSPKFSAESLKVLGAMLGVFGTTLAFWGAYTFRRAGTHVRPSRPVTALVTGGPFRYSRNPFYLAMTVIYIGITLYVGFLWPLVTLVPALIMVQWRIVRREEQFLESRFGEDYRAYKARVHRWI